MTTLTTALPNPKDVRDMLTELLGRDVTVAPAEPMPLGERDLVTVAVYVNDALRTAAVVMVDLPLSAYAGAAIGLVPAGGAEAAIEDRELAPSVKENLDEVLNIVSALFNTDGAPHLKLYATYGWGEAPPTDISAVMRAFGQRLDLAVTIAGYGSGRLGIVLA
jgi:hypothetical protein